MTSQFLTHVDKAAQQLADARTDAARAEIEKAQAKLNNPAFTQKAPPAVLEEHRKRLGDWEAKLRQAQAGLTALDQ